MHVATKRQNAKCGNSAKGTCILLLTNVIPQTPLDSSVNWNSLPTELQSLLCQYTILFDTPQGLSPLRQHDHKILLSDETKKSKSDPIDVL